MITRLTTSLPLTVYNTSGSYPDYSRQPTVVRWNPQINALEAEINGLWQTVGNEVQLTLDPRVQTVVTWAEAQMNKERDIEELAERFPMIRELKTQLDTMVALVKDYD